MSSHTVITIAAGQLMDANNKLFHYRPVILAFNDKQIATLTIPTFLCSINLVEVVKKNTPKKKWYKLPKKFLVNFLWAKNAKIAKKPLFFIQNRT